MLLRRRLLFLLLLIAIGNSAVAVVHAAATVAAAVSHTAGIRYVAPVVGGVAGGVSVASCDTVAVTHSVSC